MDASWEVASRTLHHLQGKNTMNMQVHAATCNLQEAKKFKASQTRFFTSRLVMCISLDDDHDKPWQSQVFSLAEVYAHIWQLKESH